MFDEIICSLGKGIFKETPFPVVPQNIY